MDKQQRRRVTEALLGRSERVSLDQLAARGTRTVRYLEGDRALALVEAVVDQLIAERVGRLADEDRRRIAGEAKERFRALARRQADADGRAARAEEELAELRARHRRALAALARRERRLENARETILSYDAEIERLAAQARADAVRIEQLQAERAERATHVAGLQDLVERLAHGIAANREAVEAMGARLAERDARAGAEMEERFRSRLGETLEEVRRALRAATAAPVDRPVEATDALVARMFDETMDSNLARLDVDVSTAAGGIEGSLERLRRMRAQALEEDDAEEGSDEAAP